jgi:hypothetical protein
MTKIKNINSIQLFDVVAVTEDLPEHKLWRGEIGAVIACYSDNAYEVEFVAQDGYTYALVTLPGNQLVPLRQKQIHSDEAVAPLAL